MIEEPFFRVEVPLPDHLVGRYGRQTEFVFALTLATQGAKAAGRSRSERHGLYEWAEFDDVRLAQDCEAKLFELVARFQQKFDAAMST